MNAKWMLLGLLASSSQALAKVDISPYVSIRSTKSVNPNKKKDTETEKIKQRQEVGVRGGISFWRLFKIQLGVGQSKLTTTEKTSAAKDEYGEIDYEKDLNMSTDQPDQEIKIAETQNSARLSIVLDPSFWIFMLRAKVGVTGTQRILEAEETGKEKTTHTEAPKYKPHSGVGAGIRLSSRMYFMAEYNFFHYQFPKIEPFERELNVNFNVSL